VVNTFIEYKGMEASGRAISGLVNAFGQFKALATQLLLAEGIGQKGPDGLVTLDLEGWYPMDAYLRALAKANEQMGDSVLHQMGVATAKGVWMPHIKDLRTLAEFLDTGYHMNHRKFGRPMWDEEKRHMREGIGHYKLKQGTDHSFEFEVSVPYPCSFDKGLLFGALRMLNVPGAILHDDSQPCRRRGSKFCTYLVRG
jgi:hypothetical protein